MKLFAKHELRYIFRRGDQRYGRVRVKIDRAIEKPIEITGVIKSDSPPHFVRNKTWLFDYK
jgi:hypothetical protein